MTISVNEQVTGHKVIVRSAAPTRSSQRRASCECGWTSSIGSTEQVMPEIRTHLEGGPGSSPAASGAADQACLQGLPAVTFT